MNWPIKDGSLVSTRGQGRTNHLVSKLHFRDAEIHVEFMLAKIWEQQQRTGVGPVFLQDHDSPVRFRHVWVRPLDDRAFLYEP